jgi:hypothetical protein
MSQLSIESDTPSGTTSQPSKAISHAGAAASSSSQYNAVKRPAQVSHNGDCHTIDSHFAAKRPRTMIGSGQKLRVLQRASGITDVSGDTGNCKEMLLKPLGFKWVKEIAVWRWDGQGDAAHDPTPKLQQMCERDGVQCELVSYRTAAQPSRSAAEEFRRLSMLPRQSSAGSPHASPPPPRPAATASQFDADCLPDDVLASLSVEVPSHSSHHVSSFDDACLPDDVLLSMPDPM